MPDPTDGTPKMLEVLERETGPAPQWTVLWLHGLGADGNDFAPIVPELLRPHWPDLRFVFPHAPVRPITINNGVRMRGWYDIVGMDIADRADMGGVDASVREIEVLIQREHQRGIPAERVLLAGFSQGGAVALSLGLQRQRPLGGLIALSTYLPDAAHAGARLQPGANTQPVFMAHGSADPVVLCRYAELGASTLRTLGFPLAWHAYPMAHQVCAEEIQALSDWMSERFAAV